MAPHSSTLAWKIPWTEDPGGLKSMGSLRVGHDWVTSFSLFTFMRWRRKWQPTPVFLPGESQGWGSLVGYCLWDHTELNTTEVTWRQQQQFNEETLKELYTAVKLQSVSQFSRSVVSDSLRPHELQHARPPCPSPTPGVHSNSRPPSQWCHPATSSSVVPFSSWPQSLPASESFPMSQLFTSGGQSTGVSALASFLPKNTQGWSSEWPSWISLQSKGLARVFSDTTVQKHQFFDAQLSSQSNSHIHTWPQEKP